MKKRPTKKETRQALDQQVAEFIARGGAITQVDQGESALEDGTYHRNSFVFGQPKQDRTPVSDSLAAIDSRRRAKTEKVSHTFSKRPRKKIIYDDFGEPVREIWVSE